MGLFSNYNPTHPGPEAERSDRTRKPYRIGQRQSTSGINIKGPVICAIYAENLLSRIHYAVACQSRILIRLNSYDNTNDCSNHFSAACLVSTCLSRRQQKDETVGQRVFQTQFPGSRTGTC
jgi:hypothetical protein